MRPTPENDILIFCRLAAHLMSSSRAVQCTEPHLGYGFEKEKQGAFGRCGAPPRPANGRMNTLPQNGNATVDPNMLLPFPPLCTPLNIFQLILREFVSLLSSLWHPRSRAFPSGFALRDDTAYIGSSRGGS